MSYREVHNGANAHEDAIWCVQWNGDKLFTCGADESVRVWDASSPPSSLSSAKSSLTGHELSVVSVVSRPSDGALTVTSCMDGSLRIFDTDKYEYKGKIEVGPLECWTLSYHPSMDIIATGTQKGFINLFSLDTNEKKSQLNSGDGKFIYSQLFNNDGTTLVAGGAGGALYIFDIQSEKLIKTTEAHYKAIRSLALSSDGNTLYSASDDERVNVFDLRSGDQISSYSAHSSWVLSIGVSPDDKHFSTGGSDKKIKVWDITKRECCYVWESKKANQIWSLSYNKTGSMLAAGSDDGSLRIFETPIS